MNYDENDDELERMRARGRRTARRGRAGSPASGRQAALRRNPPAGRRRPERNEEQAYYDEEFGQEEYGHDQYGYDQYGNNQYGRTEYGYGQAMNEDDYEDIILDNEFQGRRPDRMSYSQSRTGQGPASNTSRQSNNVRNPQKAAKSGRRGRRQEEIYDGGSGKGRDASGRPNQGQMEKKQKKKTWKGIILLLLAAVIGYGAWMFLHRPSGIWNIAVFGVDSRDGNTKNALADVQMICSIDRSTGEIKLVSVYRDTYLKIDSEGTYHKINEAYFKGGHKQAVAALEENLDIRIDDYATFNWKSVAEAINILGGIDLEITQAEFEFINGFITETVNSTGIGSVQLTKPGMNHLDGVQAVAYSRLRLMDTDFQRTERQRKVVQLALDKAKQADGSTLASLATYLIPQISTSVGADDVLPLVKDIKKFHIGETAGFPFSRQTMRVDKRDCVVPTTLESNVILLHQFLYGAETSYSPSSAVKKISSHISEKTGLYEEGKAAPTGNSSSGGSSGGSKTPVQTAPAKTLPPETLTVEESAQESTVESTTEESETVQESTEDTDETKEIGPGVTSPAKDPDQTKEETKEEEKGPGAQESTKPSVNPTQPSATEAAKPEEPGFGPESGNPGPGPGSANPGESSLGEAGPGE